jgi:phenylacetaldehyde dehydrogenase
MDTLFVHPRVGRAATEFLGRKHQLLIGGKWVDAKSGKTFDTYDPGTGRVIARVAEADAADIDLAVAAARKAFEGNAWARMTPSDRSKLIWRLAEAMEAHGEELAELEALNNGKSVASARHGDVGLGAEMFRYMAGWATKLTGETFNLSMPGHHHAYTMREPIGVVGQIIPWNGPLLMAAWKLAPALATGCTVVLKPALRLGELIQEVGIPDGVVNIVPGFGETAGAALAAHPDVDKIAFTGSGETGRLIIKAATGNLKKVSLELGGKSPVIIFPDADLSVAIPGAAGAIFNNSGQVCAAGSRLFAHKKVFDQMVDGIAREAEKLKVGHGLDEGTQMGPLVSQDQLDRVTGYLHQGEAAGAKVVTGGKRIGNEGYFVAPTVLTNTRPDMSVVREEIFGPVLCAMTFDDDDLDRIAKEANDTIYGLAGSIWTRDLGTAHKMARRIRAGRIGVNTHGSLDASLPFGGYKQSGWGREKGREVLELYTEVKSVVMAF